MATLALSLAGQVIGGAVGGPIGATIGRALGALAGSVVDAALFAEKPQQPAAGRDIRITGSSEGIAIPRLYGWSRLNGNIIWATELERMDAESSGAKGTSAPEQEEICISFAVAFCEGEVARLGRVWADGQLLETENLNFRFYRGTAAQAADSLIEAKQGAGLAPAYRGTCYLVFERLPLSQFGYRIPNISVELCRVVGELEPMIRSVTVIPGATEFGYDPIPRVRVMGPGRSGKENAHQSALVSDWTLSIDELTALCPNLEHVSLVVAWFGDDLRCGECTVRPKVESASRSVRGTSWSVAGVTRGTAEVMSTFEGGAAYGGTPSDASVSAAIADLKARGLEVTLYPMILMDIPVGNPMGQPAYPWRGRISCDPAPGTVGSPEGTAALDAQVAAFVGSSTDWGFRRFVRHYAALADHTRADALVIGSELRGLTSLRGSSGFPFVDALVTLAGEAKAMAPDVKLTYAADWSEYHGLQPADAPGDKLFNLDPLWASNDIDAVGIDNYMPAGDWRNGEDHPDYALWDGPHDLGYLTANIAGGEGYEWYYASDADRIAGMRSPISDGAHGEHWIWRFKDIAGWWGNAHHERVGGVRSTTPTAWVPAGKSIWFTELGCAAVDKAANQPNRFPDRKSVEDGRPWFSSGAPDALMQRQFLRAQLGYWADKPMVERISLWTWDARPYPAFPAEEESWADAVNHAAGHWLTGRLGALAADELAAAVAADHGTTIDGEAGLPLVHGLAVETLATARDALAGVLGVTGLSVREGDDGLELVRPVSRSAVLVEEVVAGDGPLQSRRRGDPSEATRRLALSYADRERDYLTGTATASRADGAVVAGADAGVVLDAIGARQAAERLLVAADGTRDALELSLPPSLSALEVGDVIDVPGVGDGPFEIVEIRDGLARRVTARALVPDIPVAVLGERPARPTVGVGVSVEPVLVAAHLPPDPATPAQSRLLLAAYGAPWPGEIDIRLAATGRPLSKLTRAGAVGELLTAVASGPLDAWDEQEIEVELYGGHVASADDAAVLAGANRILVETDAGEWEAIGFAEAQLIGPRHYRLTRLRRGQGMTDPAIGPTSAGNRVVVLDGAAAVLPVEPGWLGHTLALRAYAGRRDATGTEFEVTFGLGPVLPLPPSSLEAVRDTSGDVALSWVRRSRATPNSWVGTGVPHDNLPEAYRVTILAAGSPVRTFDVGVPAATYAAADQTSDFGALPVSFEFTVAQISPLFGPGHPATGTFNA